MTTIVQDTMNEYPGTPDRLMRVAEDGYLPKDVLAEFLTTEPRRKFFDACARIERGYTERCAAMDDPCLASGCSAVGDSEICLQPLLRAGCEYRRACGREWTKLFQAPENRTEEWRWRR
jgi:hypothetical protein